MKALKTSGYIGFSETRIASLERPPQNWCCLRFKDLIANFLSGVSVNATDIPASDGKIGVLKVSCVGVRGFRPEENKTVWKEEYNRVRVSPKRDTIIISRANTPELVGASAYISQDYPNLFLSDKLWQTVLSKCQETDPKWLSYIIGSSSLRYLFAINATGASPSMKNLGQDKFMALEIPVPPLSTQKTIARWLDRETERIDGKVALLEEKARLYKELKQSLINETVTRGLDPSAPLRDSGVDWIGDIPEHWEVGSVTELTDPISVKNEPDKELLSVYRDHGVIIKSSRDDNHNRAGKDLANYKLVKPGWLVINKMKTWQGSLGVSEYEGIVSPAYIICKTNLRKVLPKYFHFLLRSRRYIDQYNRLSYGVRNDQWDMRYNDFKYLPALLPPLEEQRKIALHIESKLSKIDQIVEAIQEQVRLLQELRKTLINDVVTGKIRVTETEGGTA